VLEYEVEAHGVALRVAPDADAAADVAFASSADFPSASAADFPILCAPTGRPPRKLISMLMLLGADDSVS
jgi:hypothetical protein